MVKEDTQAVGAREDAVFEHWTTCFESDVSHIIYTLRVCAT